MIFLNRIVMAVCMIILTALVSMLFVQVILRYFFHNPLDWPDEASRFLLIWITFLGAASAVWHKGHLGINYFINKFPEKLKKMTEFIVHAAIIFFLIVAFLASFNAIGVSLGISLTSLPLSWGHAFISFPIGIALCLLFYIDLTIHKRVE